LLIVVAIILILIAIALPNFLAAQARAKVTRTQGDIRSQGIALESYFLDWNQYTKDSDSSLDLAEPVPWEVRANGFLQLTSPVQYLTGFLQDPFGGPVAVDGLGAFGYRIGSGSWSYPDDSVAQDNQASAAVFNQMGKQEAFVVIGVGPDQARARCAYKCFPYMSTYEGGASTEQRSGETDGQPRMYTSYTPTNGTESVGDLYYFGGRMRSGRFMLDGQIVGNLGSPGGAVW
jgi:type II secretory pathway pseudopilin PulG